MHHPEIAPLRGNVVEEHQQRRLALADLDQGHGKAADPVGDDEPDFEQRLVHGDLGRIRAVLERGADQLPHLSGRSPPDRGILACLFQAQYVRWAIHLHGLAVPCPARAHDE